MCKLLRYLAVRKGKRQQDESGPKEITPADRVRAWREKAQALEQKSRAEDAVGIPGEPLPARVRPLTAPPERSPPVPAHPVEEPPQAPVIARDGQVVQVPLEFRGSAPEYFRIWIVNVFLTLVTLGIYSAWAKVRTKRYFYANTSVDGSSFEYLAQPGNILRGRLVVAGVVIIGALIAYTVVSFEFWLFLGFLLAWPWLTVTAFRFNARNSAYRNIRFGFQGTTAQALATYFKGYLIVVVTLGIGYYYFTWMRHRFRVDNSRFGTSAFSFQLAEREGYFSAYFAATFFGFLVAMVAFLAAWTVIQTVSPDSIIAAVGQLLPGIVYGIFYYAYLKVRFTNILFNNSRLAGHSFSSTLQVLPLFAIYVTNLLAIVLSAGFLIPWAMIRTARYRVDNLKLLALGDLTEFIGSQEEEISAVGEEVGDFLDLDFGL